MWTVPARLYILPGAPTVRQKKPGADNAAVGNLPGRALRRAAAADKVQMKGHFTSHYLAEVLRDIFLEEMSGVLRLESSSGPRIVLRFDRGMLVDGDSPSGAPTLAASLRDDGLVSAEILLELVPDCANASDLASTLLDRAVVTQESIAQGIKGLIRRLLAEAFAWQGGIYTFEQGKPDPGPFVPDVLFTFEAILVGITSMGNFDPLKEVLLSLPGRLRMSERMFLPVHRLALKPHHGFVLSRIDGSMTFSELAQVVPDDSVEEALKFAYGLAVFGVIVFTPPLFQGPFRLREIIPAHHEARARAQKEEALIRETLSQIGKQSPAEILGVQDGADAGAIRAAFDECRARFRRERFCEKVRDDLKKDLDLIEAKITEAYFNLELGMLETQQRLARDGSDVTTLSGEEFTKRREFFKTEAQTTQEQNVRLSENYHQKAKEYFREGAYYDCIQFCKMAIRFNSEAAASYQLMADALLKNPDRRWQRQAEEAYLKAVELDPFNAEFFVSLGLFYKEWGMDARARKMLEKALEILPSHQVAARELKHLGR